MENQSNQNPKPSTEAQNSSNETLTKKEWIKPMMEELVIEASGGHTVDGGELGRASS